MRTPPNPRRLTTAGVALVIAGLLLAGCTPAQDGDLAPVDDSLPLEEEDVPTAEPTTDSLPVIISDQWVLDSGYSYSTEVNTIEVTAEKDVLNAPPGSAIIRVGYAITGTVTNTTPERNAPWPVMFVQAVWPTESAICSSTKGVTGPAISFPKSDDEGKWCSTNFGPFPINGTDVTKLHEADLALGATAPTTAGLTASQYTEIGVPEAAADAIINELKSPYAWTLGRTRGPADVAVCSFSGPPLVI